MSIYYITSEIKSVSGWQQWRVEAESKEEALELFQQGNAYFIDEDIEVLDIEDKKVDIEVVEETNIELISEPLVEEIEDKYVKAVTEAMKERSRVGLRKYGVTLERDDLTTLEWVKHLQEELMDSCNYLEVLKDKLRDK